MKIALFETSAREKAFFQKQFKGHQLLFFDGPVDPKNLAPVKDAEIIVTFIYSKIDSAVLAKLPKLKMIATKSTGYDHIDVAACRHKKIMVCNVPFYGENTVAEHTFALILALSRNVHKSYVRTLRSDFSIAGLEGFDLKDKTLGVVGTGHIGLHVIKMAKGFGMKVLAYDVIQNNFMTEVLGFEYVPLNTLLRRSHIITLHVPYLPQTHHLLNRRAMRIIKRGAILINTARGAIVDTSALIWALDKKILAGAGLDVLEGEALIKEEHQLLHDKTKGEAVAELVRDHTLLTKDNVVFTPHIAFYSREALQRISETTAQTVLAFIRHQPIHAVK